MQTAHAQAVIQTEQKSRAQLYQQPSWTLFENFW